MKLGTLEFAIYTVQNFLHLIFQYGCVASSVDKVGVIASEPVAYAFIETLSLIFQLHNQSRIMITNSNKDQKGAFLSISL
jgi:hypothetical protein